MKKAPPGSGELPVRAHVVLGHLGVEMSGNWRNQARKAYPWVKQEARAVENCRRSAEASSRMGEIDVRARFSRRFLPFRSLPAAVAGERYFPLS
jgi:hypothetical protein